MNKIFLLTGFSTEMRYGGGAIVRFLIERFEPNTVAWFSLSAPGAALDPRLKKIFVGHYSYRAFGNRRLRLERFWAWYHRVVWPKLAARRIISALAETGASTLWIVLDYHLVSVAAELLRRRPGQHLHFSIHDHPNEMARRHFRSFASVAAVDEGFDVVKNADASFDAISEELLVATGLAGRRSAVVTMGCDEKRRADAIPPPAKDGPLRIGHAGSYFPPERAQELVEGLKLWSAKTGRAWQLHAFGAKMPLPMPPEIRWRGFFAPETLFKELGNMDILLLALEGHGALNAPALTSVPTKLVSYLEVGRVILAMVPERSATARIIRDHSMGPVVSTSAAQAVARAIEDAFSWNIAVANRGRADLLGDRFDPDAIFRRFTRLVAPGSAQDVAAPTRRPERYAKLSNAKSIFCRSRS